MVPELQRLANLVRAAYHGPAWHGPSLGESFAGVTAALAVRRPVAAAHTIAELARHCLAWERFVTAHVRGKPIDITDAENFPPTATLSEAEWAAIQEDLVASNDALCTAIASLTTADLDRVATERGMTVSDLIVGAAQHHVYHAGQIGLLKKALG